MCEICHLRMRAFIENEKKCSGNGMIDYVQESFFHSKNELLKLKLVNTRHTIS